ncbi:7-carboxy-7-deazaguanine synthase QueE [Candidatus Atelocyanobacterium thalassae]|uniref:7-carboxy-7-deazaguanine synthase n=1 Tax=cyanobacterium endosymbiont of Braarudosphaera bigelowii TaxID=1285375 RepID=A0ABM7U5N4_9CHRO|nr:7-carboxy-7-deazaguanine synthase QueE [Candidatus Atelocyanobacterium thalassa]BDA40064.1 7-carboxy-7-deazaguanine synthase [cyanobacterium endosymbiont of Braarudosphaera bigelowii]
MEKSIQLNKNDLITYPIAEIFHSIQGEGAWTGVSAFFIRLAGCNVGCPWCDQKESWKHKTFPKYSSKTLAIEAHKANASIIVITGGEPLMYNLFPLTNALQNLGMQVHLETSGSYPFSGNFDWITLSPKPFKIPHESIYDKASELKVIVANQKDFDWAEEQKNKTNSQSINFLQPEWNSDISSSLIYNYIRKHPEWRISLQTHKFLGIR